MTMAEASEPTTQIDSPVILVVDDDPGIQTLLSRYLREQGFAVVIAGDSRAFDAVMASGQSIDLIVLDIMLPGEDGLSIARRLDPMNRPPLIILSARGEDVDRIVGLEIGADDYLPKPFNPRELIARIRAVLRRGGPAIDPSAKSPPRADNRQYVGDFSIDAPMHQAFLHDKLLDLTRGEWQLLAFFLERPNRVISRDQIMDHLKGYERSAFDRSIDVRVTRLRRKIEENPTDPRYLVTIWGEGYLFVPAGRMPRVSDQMEEG
ncbi:response regulator [Halothiobacillus diazotrophicus]|nr:response regulator [Halothiobacillus diazotrophicus]